jgi:hypothetical protein
MKPRRLRLPASAQQQRAPDAVVAFLVAGGVLGTQGGVRQAQARGDQQAGKQTQRADASFRLDRVG